MMRMYGAVVSGDPFSPAAAASAFWGGRGSQGAARIRLSLFTVVTATTRTVEGPMPKSNKTDIEQEPIGIVISSGAFTPIAPRFSAYVWGQSEDTPSPEPTEVKAA